MSVNVLCPNGRRQAVKVTPNKTILQIIDEVCAKRGFESSKHDLKHGRNILDVSLTFRFSGIPNNGKLELVERDSPRSSTTQVTIALQLESGERRQKEFSSDVSLAEMVEQLQNPDEDLLHLTSHTDLHPVIVNIREEIIGKALLEHTTLQAIGLVTGRVALRLIYRAVDQTTLDLIASQIEKERIKVGEATPASNLKSAECTTVNASTDDTRVPTHKMEQPPKQVISPEQMEVDSSLASAATNNNTSNSQTSQLPLDTTDSVNTTTAVAQSPSSAHQTINPTENAVKEEKERNIATSSVSSTDSTPVPPSVQPQIQTVRPKVPKMTAHPPMAEFKFPEETAGKDLYRNELSDTQVATDHLPCERELVVYSMDESTSTQSSSHDDLPDDFFEVTKDDLQKMIRHLRDQVSHDENAPLLTSSMRQARLENNYSKYEFSIIRFHFPDHMVVQAKFRPRETVHSLIKFVRSNMKDQSKSFNLYTTPPKKVFDDMAMTLIVGNLVPMAIVYVSFNEPVDGSILCDEILSLKKTRQAADSNAKQSLPEPAPRPPPSHSTVAAPASSNATRNSAGNRGSASSSSTQKQFPKWYKPPGK